MNLFASLFRYRPREGNTPAENFLTEALAYVLSNDRNALNAWCECLFGAAGPARDVTIQTQVTSPNGSGTFDLTARGFLGNEPLYAIVEHKWESRYDPQQLARYAAAIPTDTNARLAFVCARPADLAAARRFNPSRPGVSYRAVSWSEVFQSLSELQHRSQLLNELLDFASNKGLTPTMELSSAEAQMFLQRGSFRDHLSEVASALIQQRGWEFMPNAYRMRPEPSDIWGRVGIEFVRGDWAPGVVFGFLHTPEAHKVELVDRSRSIDLMFRIETSPGNLSAPAAEALRGIAPAMRRAGATVHCLGETRNGNTLLLARCCLSDVIADDQAINAQMTNIYDRWRVWAELVFGNAEIVAALEQIGPRPQP